MICYPSHKHIPNGLAMEYNLLVGLAIFYPLLNSHFPKLFNPLSTVYYDTSALFSVDHCLLKLLGGILTVRLHHSLEFLIACEIQHSGRVLPSQ